MRPGGSGEPRLVPGSRVLIGAGTLCGLAWAASPRDRMIQDAGEQKTFHWFGPFVLILLPAAVLGGLLGCAASLQRTGLVGGSRQRLADAETTAQSRIARWGTGLAVTIYALALLAEPGSRGR